MRSTHVYFGSCRPHLCTCVGKVVGEAAGRCALVGAHLQKLSDGQTGSAGEGTVVVATEKHPSSVSVVALQMGVSRQGLWERLANRGAPRSDWLCLMGRIAMFCLDLSQHKPEPASGAWQALGDGHPWLYSTVAVPTLNPLGSVQA